MHPLSWGRAFALSQTSTLSFSSTIETHIIEIVMMCDAHSLIEYRFA